MLSQKKVDQTKEGSYQSSVCLYDAEGDEPYVQHCETSDVPSEPRWGWEEVRVDLDAACVDKGRSQVFQHTEAAVHTAPVEPDWDWKALEATLDASSVAASGAAFRERVSAAAGLHGSCTDWVRSLRCSANCWKCAAEGVRSNDVLERTPWDSQCCNHCMPLEVDREAQACLCPRGRLQAEVHGQRTYHSAPAKESDILDA